MSERRPPRRVVLAIILAGYRLVLIDVSILMAALPSIRAALGFSDTSLSWAQNACTLTFGGLLLLGARTGDLLGRRRTFVLGIGVFTVASLAVGLAQSPAGMIAARAVQGIGAAMLAPSTLALLSTSFPEGQQRSRAMAACGALAGIGTAARLLEEDPEGARQCPHDLLTVRRPNPRVDARIISSGTKVTPRWSCCSSVVSAISSSVAVRPRFARGWRTDVSGTAAAVGELDVVVAHDGEVGRDGDAREREVLEHPEREQVVGAEERRRPPARRQPDQTLCGLTAARRTSAHPVSRTTRCGIRPPDAAIARRAPSRRSVTWPMRDRPADERDALVAVLDQVGDGELAAQHVVHGDAAAGVATPAGRSTSTTGVPWSGSVRSRGFARSSGVIRMPCTRCCCSRSR